MIAQESPHRDSTLPRTDEPRVPTLEPLRTAWSDRDEHSPAILSGVGFALTHVVFADCGVGRREEQLRGCTRRLDN